MSDQTERPVTARIQYALDHPSVTIEEIDRQRSLGWPDFDAEDYCHRCGGKNPQSWYVDSDRWNMAFGDDRHLRNSIVCPGCFVLMHERATGMWTTWKLEVDGVGFRWMENE